MPVEQPAIAIAPVGEIPADVLRGLLPAIEARFPGRVARLAKGACCVRTTPSQQGVGSTMRGRFLTG